MKSLFYGGTHPPQKKELCIKTPEPLAAPGILTVPLRQHIGAPCKPLVAVGDQVNAGQKIGDGEGLCVPVHTPVSGVVEDIKEMPYPGGGTVLSVIIRNNFTDTKDNTLTAHPEDTVFSAEELIRIVREAGITGMGGATFPTDVKIRSGIGKVDTLIANGCECEPYITADDLLLRERARDVLRGLRCIASVLEPKRIVIAVEDNKKEAIAAVTEALSSFEGMVCMPVPTCYPQGAEKQLIMAVTGREVPSGGLPADAGCAVFNVATLAAVCRAVYEGKPLTERIVTVTGEAVREPKNVIALIGTPFSALIEAAGGLTEDADKVISGGPMMGIAQSALDAPVTKGTNAVLCLSQKDNCEVEHPVCIRCGKCLTVCPIRLQPLNMYLYAEAKNAEELQKLHLNDCIECGCCAYVCPAKLPLTARFKEGKRFLKEETKA